MQLSRTICAIFWLGGVSLQTVCGQIFLSVPGGTGSSQDPRHIGWSDVSSLSFDANRPVSATNATFYPISIVKSLDGVTPALLSGCASGQRFDTVQIESVQSSGYKLQVFTITLTGARVASGYYGGQVTSQNAGLSDNFGFNYEQIAWTYTEFTDARPLTNYLVTWNVTATNGATNASTPIDSDGDGIPDWWMNLYFGHPTAQAADNSRPNDDPDGDGMSNLQEYLAGTDPLSKTSVFRMTTQSGPNGTLQLVWPSLAGKTYNIYSSATIAPNSWTLFTTVPSAGDGFTTNTIPRGGGRLFFRVQTF